jgi:intein-encoded DNA endonuclease-like protein
MSEESSLWAPKSSRELAYVIGVLWNGDGTVSISRSREKYNGHIRIRYYYYIQLKVKSRRFAEKFNVAMAIVLNRRTVKMQSLRGYYIVRYKSKRFVKWWMKVIHEPNKKTLKEIVLKYPVEYLQGRFDSDGSPDISKYRIRLVGAEKNLDDLKFDRKLCKMLGLEPSDIKMYYAKGAISYIEGRTVIAKMNGYRFSVPARNFLKFIDNLNDESKDTKLQYIKRILNREPVKKYPLRLKHEIMNLLKQGVKKTDIALKYDIPYKTLEKWKI